MTDEHEVDDPEWEPALEAAALGQTEEEWENAHHAARIAWTADQLGTLFGRVGRNHTPHLLVSALNGQLLFNDQCAGSERVLVDVRMAGAGPRS